jgi:hypothetical protein
VLHIFRREAWLPEPAPVHFRLLIKVTHAAARARLVAEWEAAPTGITAAFGIPSGSGERWDLAFYPSRNGLFTRWETPKGSDCEIALSSPSPPDRLTYAELPNRTASITAAVLPACLEPSVPGPASLDLVPMVTQRLSEDDLTGAIGLFTYSRSGIPAADVAAAGREVLAYVARYPLQRDPLLGAFLASLCNEAAAQ